MKKLPTKDQLNRMRQTLVQFNFFCKRDCNTCFVTDRLDEEEACPVKTLESLVEGVEGDLADFYYQQMEKKGAK